VNSRERDGEKVGILEISIKRNQKREEKKKKDAEFFTH